jgi:hypothetical protein
MYGIQRNASLPSVPDLACVEAAIRSAPGVLGIQHEYTRSASADASTDVPREEHYYFIYDVGAGHAVLELAVNHYGEAKLSQYCSSLDVRPSQAALDAARPIIIRIENALRERCGITPLLVREVQSGVKCDAE